MTNFTTKDILSLLADHTPEEIAESFTAALNAALKQQEEEKEAKRKAEELANKKKEDTALLLDHLRSYLTLYYPEFPSEKLKTNPEVVIRAFDGTFGDKDLIKNIETITKILRPLEKGDFEKAAVIATCPKKSTPETKPNIKPIASLSFDEIDKVFNQFLETHNLK